MAPRCASLHRQAGCVQDYFQIGVTIFQTFFVPVGHHMTVVLRSCVLPNVTGLGRTLLMTVVSIPFVNIAAVVSMLQVCFPALGFRPPSVLNFLDSS